MSAAAALADETSIARAQSFGEAAQWGGTRILHVIGGFGFGGTERLCLDVARQAAAHGGSAVVAGLDPSRSGMEQAFADLPVARVLRGPGRRHRAVLRWMRAVILREGPGAVFVYAFGLTHLVVALAARLAGNVPVFVSAGNPPPPESGRWKWRLVVAASRLLGVPIHSCSSAVEAALLGLGVGLPKGSRVIPNGCDVAGIATRAEAARRGRRPGGPLVIGMVGRLDAIKDHATLIRAFAGVVRARASDAVELWLIGEGPLRPALERLAEAEGVAASVRFPGSRSDVPELLGQMDIFAFATTGEEGFGIALIEAMAAGLPVVASDVPACREVVGEAGILVEAGNEGALAAEIGWMLGSAETRACFARLARERAGRFDVAACAEGWYGALVGSLPAEEMR